MKKEKKKHNKNRLSVAVIAAVALLLGFGGGVGIGLGNKSNGDGFGDGSGILKNEIRTKENNKLVEYNVVITGDSHISCNEKKFKNPDEFIAYIKANEDSNEIFVNIDDTGAVYNLIENLEMNLDRENISWKIQSN